MLLFYCNYCHEMLSGTDYETTDQIVGRLGDHLMKCPAATFSCEGTSGIARRKLGDLRTFLENEHLVERIRLRSPAPAFEKIH